MNPRSRDYLELASPDPTVPPALHPRFLDHPEDVALLTRGICIARQILAASALAHACGAELLPGTKVVSNEALEDYVRRNLATVFHPVGTCKIGPANDPMSVVNAVLCVHGVERLRVIDASIMPQIVSGNTNAPTMMIAERGAEFVRKVAA